jgi:acyl-coenzyme A thioesterase PaaI-like protein
MPAHHDGCAACGENSTGLRMDMRAGEGGSVVCELEVRPEHDGSPGIMHGGIIALVFDEIMGYLQVFHDCHAVTVELTTRYRKPVPAGTRLFVRAAVEEDGERTLRTVATAHLGGPDGPLAAEARAVYVKVSDEHFAQATRR